MVIVKITGGLGNQMFQYAAAKALSLRLQAELKLDISAYDTYDPRKFELGIFDERYRFSSRQEIKRLTFRHGNLMPGVSRRLLQHIWPLSPAYCKEPHLHFDASIRRRSGNVYLDGYWQSEEYFLDSEAAIRKAFTFNRRLSRQSELMRRRILASASVSLHVRRGDYITDAHVNSVHGTCDIEYYRKAVLHIAQRVANPLLFVFSDDIAWTTQNLHFPHPVVFVENGAERADWEDMYLMSLCRHHVIANSSFSWWGAWLNRFSEKMIVAPQHWFNDETIDTDDLIPKRWIRL